MPHKAENRKQIAEAIAPTNYLNKPQIVLEQILTGSFADGLGNIVTQPNRLGSRPHRPAPPSLLLRAAQPHYRFPGQPQQELCGYDDQSRPAQRADGAAGFDRANDRLAGAIETSPVQTIAR